MDNILTFILIGFAAQLVDGALGMAYGTLSTAILLAMGVPPATVSVTVHSAQFFTTGLSGLSHALFRNIDWRLFAILAIGGSVGGLMGAQILVHTDAATLRPWISSYLLIVGIIIVVKVLFPGLSFSSMKSRIFVPVLGLAGGLLDAIGGGWGPLVTSHLIVRGQEEPRKIIGSVNSAEFFVKTAIAATLVTTVGFGFQGSGVFGLLIGGVAAAPFGAFILRYIKPEKLMLFVGLLIAGLSVWQLVK